jgi:hypothetical protein
MIAHRLLKQLDAQIMSSISSARVLHSMASILQPCTNSVY